MTTSAIPLHAMLRVAPDQISCDLGGETVILNARSGEYYELNSVGRRIWTLAQDGSTVAAVRDALLAEFDVEPERCTADLLRVLGELAAAELVQVTS